MKLGSILALAFCTLGASAAQADATLEYALADADSGTVGKKMSIARFFARVDSSDQPEEYLLFQAGKFFPLYRVNTAEGTYALLTAPVKPTLSAATRDASSTSTTAGDNKEGKGAAESKSAASPIAPENADASMTQDQAPKEQNTATRTLNEGTQTPEAGKTDTAKLASDRLPVAPTFKPTPKSDTVAGVNCRIVIEWLDGKPAIEHCMANKAALRITERESRTLARTFVMARQQGYGWLGATTKDEDFVSVRSKALDDSRSLELVTISTKPLEPGYLKVPPKFKKVDARSKGSAESVPEAAPAPQADSGAVEAAAQQ